MKHFKFGPISADVSVTSAYISIGKNLIMRFVTSYRKLSEDQIIVLALIICSHKITKKIWI